MSKFKKGDRVKITEVRYKGCVGRVIVGGKIPDVALNGVFENQIVFNSRNLKKVPACIDNLLVGDCVKRRGIDTARKVLAIQGDMVWLSGRANYKTSGGISRTKHQLKRGGYTVVSDGEENEEAVKIVGEKMKHLKNGTYEVVVEGDEVTIKDKE